MSKGAFALVAIAALVAGCGRDDPTALAGYEAACHGPPVRTVEEREKAMVAGYTINRAYDCIDKESFLAVEKSRAEWEAARTPEAIAARAAEREKMIAREQEEKARAAAARAAQPPEPTPLINLRLPLVDVNRATEAQLAQVAGVGPVVARQIIEQRRQHRISGWPDLVHRVVGLSAAQTAVFASIGGLTVDGKSLDGAAPNAVMAAQIKQREQRREEFNRQP